MFNRGAKTDEDLLREQNEFIKNPKANQVVEVVGLSNKNNSNRSKKEAFVDTSLGSIVTDVIEHIFPKTEGQTIYDSPMAGKCGFPIVPVFGKLINEAGLLDAVSRLQNDDESQSIFSRQLLAAKQGHVLTRDEAGRVKPLSSKATPQPLKKLSPSLEALANAGPMAIRGKIFSANEIVRIHESNLDLLSRLSEDEISKEREQIMASIDPKVLSFLMHKKSKIVGNSISESTEYASESCDKKVDENGSTKSLLSTLGVNTCSSIPHMNVLEPEKLEWMLDVGSKMPPDVKTKDGATMHQMSCQARFDLEGRVVPPYANVDTHLGLHHHGDEPERAGYTMTELFHLCSSSQPTQRRLALSCLAACLAASRRGHHAVALQPPSLLSAFLVPAKDGGVGGGGIGFILRWALDQEVKEGTRASGAGGCSSSITIGECLRAMANLISDDQGEVLLGDTFEWTSCSDEHIINCQPSAASVSSSEKFHLFNLTDDDDDGNVNGSRRTEADASDHVALMSADPVGCLFEKTRLADRLAWLLSTSGLQLAVDAAAHWLPAILIRGVRHSLALASKIYHTPRLVCSLLDKFLPTKWNPNFCQPSVIDSNTLIGCPGLLPLPGILKLMRVFAQRSDSIRLLLVNDHGMVERCLHFLEYENDFVYSDHDRPSAMLQNIVTMLQIESLRFLAVCLRPGAPRPSKAVDLVKCLKKVQIDKMSFWSAEVIDLAASKVFNATINPDMHQISDMMRHHHLSPVLIAVAMDLSVSLGDNHKHSLVERIFAGPIWKTILNYFIRYESVLTGFPKHPSHVAPVTIELPYTPFSADTPLSWTQVPGDIDDSLLTPICVSSALPCCPDLGMFTHLQYHGAGGCAPSTPCAIWPSTTPRGSREVFEQMDAQSPSPNQSTLSALPLIAAAVRCGGAVAMQPWWQKLVHQRTPPIAKKMKSGASGALPHGLMRIEGALMGGCILQMVNLPSSDRSLLWRASASLMPYLFFGQEDLLCQLLTNVFFPPRETTPPERVVAGLLASSAAKMSLPWPNSHPDAATAFAVHAHRVYTEYFTDVLHGRSVETIACCKTLQCRASCDPILPADWYYMPLLEEYFFRNRQLADPQIDTKDCTSDSGLTEDGILRSTAILGWIRGFLSLYPPDRSSIAGFHFTRLCCAILANHSAGGLFFNLSGVILIDLLRTLLPLVDLDVVDGSSDTNTLPLDMVSLYDLYIELLEHYAAVSYSAPLFANLLLLFSQSNLPANYRSALWGEHEITLRAMTISPQEFVFSATVYEALFEPAEVREDVLWKYANALCRGVVHPDRQPTLALLAVHHLNRFIYSTQTPTESPLLRKLVLTLKWVSAREPCSRSVGFIRRYKKYMPLVNPIDPSDLVSTAYKPPENRRLEDFMVLYTEEDLPRLRFQRWSTLFGII